MSKVSSKRAAAQAARIIAASDATLMKKSVRELFDMLRAMAASVLSQAEK